MPDPAMPNPAMPSPAVPSPAPSRAVPALATALGACLLGAGGVALVTLAGSLLAGTLGTSSAALLYFLPVLLVSIRGGLWPGLATSALAALAFNFFLVAPRYTLDVADTDDLATMLMLFAVAAVVSDLAARLRAAAAQATARAQDDRILARFAVALGDCADPDAVAALLRTQLAASFDAEVALLHVADGAVVAHGGGTALALGGLDLAAALWADAHAAETGRGTAVMAEAGRRFVPLVAGGRRLGVVALGGSRGMVGAGVPGERARLLAGLVEEAAQALGRRALAAEQAEVERVRARDALRGSLLASLAHDLRTPLTVILGEAAALGGSADAPAARIAAEARRLHRRIDNLLDLARVEAGALDVRLQPVDLGEAAASAVDDLRATLAGRTLELAVAPDLPLVRADPVLLHHILINLLDNAAKFSAADAPIRIAGAAAADGVTLAIVDGGSGIAAGQEAAIFDRFVRMAGSDQAGGTGLGLAIVRAFAQALGASVGARNRADGAGAAVTLGFPADRVVRPDLARAVA